jgi:hypothetical protein
MEFSIIGGLGLFDHRRMNEDLGSTSTLLSIVSEDGRRLRAPLSLLAQFGGDILYAMPGDAGGWSIRADERLHLALGANVFRTAFRGALNVSWMHAALVLGRRDLYRNFVNDRGLDVERAMRWFVLHGIDEHRLWRFLDARFVRELRDRSIPAAGGFVSPIDLILIAERPDLLSERTPGSPEFAAFMDDWLFRNGIHEYKLFWLLDRRAFEDLARRRAGDDLLLPERAGETSAARLERSHAQRRFDIYIDQAGAKEGMLSGVSRIDAAERDRYRSGPPEDALPPGALPGLVVRTPLSGRLMTSFGFHPGGTGPAATIAGYFGRPSAAGCPMLSQSVTFYLSAPRSDQVVILIDMDVANDDSKVLVLVDGKPSDLFGAQFLRERAAKVHVASRTIGDPLTVEIECIRPDDGPMRGPAAWLRSLSVFEAPAR